MAVSFISAGALAANATTVTLALVAPGSLQTNDILVAPVMGKGNQVNTFPSSESDGISAWTKFVEVNNTVNQRLTIAWARVTNGANASGNTVDVTKPVDDNLLFIGAISVWRGCKATGDPTTGAGTPTTSANASSDTVTYATFDSAIACALVAIGCYNNDLTTMGLISGTNPTFRSRFDLESGTGTDGSLFCQSGVSDSTATGARTHITTSTADDVNIGCLFGLEPDVADTILCYDGFEDGSTGRNFVFLQSPATVVTGAKRSGEWGLQCIPAGAKAYSVQQIDVDENSDAVNAERMVATYYTFAFRVNVFPAAERCIASVAAVSLGTVAEVRCGTTGIITGVGATATGTVKTIKLGVFYVARLKIVSNGTSELSIQEGAAGTFTTPLTFTASNFPQSYIILGNNIANDANLNIYFDDWVVRADGFQTTAFYGVARMDPNANGNYTAWTGTFADVDDFTDDGDTTFISSSTANAVESVGLESASSAGIRNCTIEGVMVYAIARDEGGNSGFFLRVRSGSTDRDTSPASNLGTTYNARRSIHLTDPSTSVAWTLSSLDSLEVGVGITVAVACRDTSLAAMILYEQAETAFGGGTNEELVLDGMNLAVSLISVSDPDLFEDPNNSNVKTLIFTSGVDNLGSGLELYKATLSSGDWDAAVGNWTVSATALAARVVGQWDALAHEGGCYVRGVDGGVTKDRIYYAGYATIAAISGDDHIKIGYLEWDGDSWERHGAAVLEAVESWEFWNGVNGHCNQPSVTYDSDTGLWHIWYTTGGASNIFYQAHAQSTDGRTWTNKTRLYAAGGLTIHPGVTKITGIHYEYMNSGAVQTGAADGIYGAYAYEPPIDGLTQLFDFIQRVSVLSKNWHSRRVEGGKLMPLAAGGWILYFGGEDYSNQTIQHVGRIQLTARSIAAAPSPVIVRQAVMRSAVY